MKKISDFITSNTKFFSFLLFFLFILISCSDKDSSDPEIDPPLETVVYDVVSAYKVVDDVNMKVMSKSKKWSNGSTIKIKFLNATVDQQNRVKSISQQWVNYANIKFEYVDNDKVADVKVAFSWNDDEVSWAYLGVDNKQVDQKPSFDEYPFTCEWGRNRIKHHKF